MRTILQSFLLMSAALSLVSCVTTAEGTGSVEDLERQPGVTPLPNMREGEFARAAANYANDTHSYRHRRHGMRGY